MNQYISKVCSKPLRYKDYINYVWGDRMKKSNVTSVDSQSNRGYYCAGRKCPVKEQCHRYTSSLARQDPKFNEYDNDSSTPLPKASAADCNFFVDVKTANQVG
jgi:hypothetical protein